MMKLQSSKTCANWPLKASLSTLFFCVVWSMPKSKTSSESSRRMCMLFSQMASFCRESSTIWGMKSGQSSGHSFFTMSTSTRFILFRKVRWSAEIFSVWQSAVIALITYVFTPCRCSAGMAFHFDWIVWCSTCAANTFDASVVPFSMIVVTACHMFSCCCSWITTWFATRLFGSRGLNATDRICSSSGVSKGCEKSTRRAAASSRLMFGPPMVNPRCSGRPGACAGRAPA
mmetsp:Transcript_14742/g.44369  ORF Transcript_14742/g.44369 Transcript_14742/m.44369 type:complete len:230 (+) Transcript_14742:2707-3396(+)